MKRISVIFLAFVIGFSVMNFSCLDHGIEPMATKIVGTVVFTGEWPEQTTFSAVALATERPPGDSLKIELLRGYQIIDHQAAPETLDFEIYPDGGAGEYCWLIVAAIGNMDSIDARNILTEYTTPDNPDEAACIELADNMVFDAGTLFVNFDEVYYP